MLALLVCTSAAYSLFPVTQPRLRAVPRLTSPAIADEARHEYLVGPVDVGCASASFERVPELALPRMNVVAKQPPLTDDAIEQFLAFIGECLDRDEAFTVLWHVKGGAFPSMKQACAARARPSDAQPARRLFCRRRHALARLSRLFRSFGACSAGSLRMVTPRRGTQTCKATSP